MFDTLSCHLHIVVYLSIGLAIHHVTYRSSHVAGIRLAIDKSNQEDK